MNDPIDVWLPVLADDWDTILYIEYLYLACQPDVEPVLEAESVEPCEEPEQKVKGTVLTS
ncbi:MAG TPA: hypothetical protein ENG69_02290 [Candidatus Korarchaeota archaeon]|nr:hypothetical protein [Candidatus Korarchaeota archaeon]